MEWFLSAVLGYVFLLLLIGLVLCRWRSPITEPSIACRDRNASRQSSARQSVGPGPSSPGRELRIPARLFRPATNQYCGPVPACAGGPSAADQVGRSRSVLTTFGAPASMTWRARSTLRCGPHEPAIARAQPHLPLPGDVAVSLWLPLLSQQQLPADPGREAVRSTSSSVTKPAHEARRDARLPLTAGYKADRGTPTVSETAWRVTRVYPLPAAGTS
jgi:hypothetical protein